MLPSLTTFLFGQGRIAAAVSGRGKYDHTFGGPHDRKGAGREACRGVLIHLLHRLDLTDPSIPIAVPGVCWLPLYYCFDFRVNDLGYRLLSDDAIEVFIPTDDPNVSDEEEWPGDGYPSEFPRSGIRIDHHDYDPTDLEDAYRWAGVFGISKLSSRDQAAAKRRAAEQAELFGSFTPEMDEEFEEALSSPFPQGRPNTPCLNPRCPNRSRKGSLHPIALMPAQPVKGVHTFGEYGGGVWLIFRMCPKCHSIRVSNQSG
jgi:hypothetical protein